MERQDPPRRPGHGLSREGGAGHGGDLALEGEVPVELPAQEELEPSLGRLVLGGLPEAHGLDAADPGVRPHHHHEHLVQRADPVGVEVSHAHRLSTLQRDVVGDDARRGVDLVPGQLLDASELGVVQIGRAPLDGVGAGKGQSQGLVLGEDLGPGRRRPREDGRRHEGGGRVPHALQKSQGDASGTRKVEGGRIEQRRQTRSVVERHGDGRHHEGGGRQPPWVSQKSHPICRFHWSSPVSAALEWFCHPTFHATWGTGFQASPTSVTVRSLAGSAVKPGATERWVFTRS